jgi:hypothetical protein
VCKNIFDSLEELVISKNQAIHLINYEDKWNNVRELVNMTLDELQTLSIQARDQALRNWFKQVVKAWKL